MTQLIKPARFYAGTAGTAGTPGDPGSPPRPGYFTYVEEGVAARPGQYVAMPGRLNASEGYRVYGPNGKPEYFYLPPTPATTRLVKVWVPPSPGRPPTPAVPAIPSTPATAFGAEWDGGATSLSIVRGDAELSFTIPVSAVGVVCGISAQRGGSQYADIDFALYASHGKVTPIESGVFVAAAQRVYNEGDTLRIARRLGVVTYSINTVVRHTSTARSVGDLSARAALFSPLDAVVDAALERSATQGARVQGSLPPLAGSGSDKPYTTSQASLPPLESTSTAKGVSGSAGVLLPLSGAASNKSYAAGAGSLRPLEGASRPTGIVPTYCLASGASAPLIGASHGTTGGLLNSAGALSAIVGKSSDRPYTESVGSLAQLHGFSIDGLVQASSFLGRISGRFTLDAYARVGTKNTAFATAPKPTLSAFAGAVLGKSAPSAGLVIAATVPIMGRAALFAPTLTLSASGTVAAIGGAIAEGARPNLTAFGGGTAGLTGPRPALTGQARTAVAGEASLALRNAPTLSAFAGAVLTQRLQGRFTLDASAAVATRGVAHLMAPVPEVTVAGSWTNIGSAILLMPMPQVFATPNGAVLLMPVPTFAAAGGAALQPWAGAWAFGLDESTDAQGRNEQRYAASEYTNYPFLRVVRFGGHHYGVSATGVYRLGGDADAGEPIAWAVETPISDFGSPQLKAMVYAYVSANLGPQARAKAVVGERGSHEYTYPNVRGAAIQNHRVAFGRGMRSRYYGVRLEDESGGELHLDSIDLEVADLTRRI